MIQIGKKSKHMLSKCLGLKVFQILKIFDFWNICLDFTVGASVMWKSEIQNGQNLKILCAWWTGVLLWSYTLSPKTTFFCFWMGSQYVAWAYLKLMGSSYTSVSSSRVAGYIGAYHHTRQSKTLEYVSTQVLYMRTFWILGL